MNFLPPRKLRAAKIPKVRKKPRRTSAIKCRAHLNWVKREFQCAIAGRFTSGVNGVLHRCQGDIDPHHVATRGAGGGDEQVVPLCRYAHDTAHRLGLEAFNRRYRVDLAETAAQLWDLSPAGKQYRRTIANGEP